MEPRRRAPPVLAKILDFDEALTERFCRWSLYFPVFRMLKSYSKTLEISCHGIPWFVGILIFIAMTSSSVLYQKEMNLLIGLILDVILVVLIKAYVRRRRPNKNRPDMFATFSIDNFSFPSGHASRAVMLAYFFTFLWPLPTIFVLPLIVWVISVCISRILLNRHYILDVFSGVILGYVEGVLLGFIWLGQDLARSLLNWFSESSYDDPESVIM